MRQTEPHLIEPERAVLNAFLRKGSWSGLGPKSFGRPTASAVPI